MISAKLSGLVYLAGSGLLYGAWRLWRGRLPFPNPISKPPASPENSELEDHVRDGVFQARKELNALHFLTDTGELPRVPREGATYPQAEGYEVLGNCRPVPLEDDEDE